MRMGKEGNQKNTGRKVREGEYCKDKKRNGTQCLQEPVIDIIFNVLDVLTLDAKYYCNLL